jgi:hypothetical protein
MSGNPICSSLALAATRSHILEGVTFPLQSIPATEHLSNSRSVSQQHVFFASQLAQYVREGKVVEDRCTDNDGLQPMIVVTAANKKPRIVIDASRQINTALHTTTMSYDGVRRAVELSTPGYEVAM